MTSRPVEVSRQADAVLPGGTRLTLPLRYSDRRLAVLSAVVHGAPAVRLVAGDHRVRWLVFDGAARGGWRVLGAHDAQALEDLRMAGAIRERANTDGVVVTTMVGDLLGPVWLAFATSTGRQERVLELSRAIRGALTSG